MILLRYKALLSVLLFSICLSPQLAMGQDKTPDCVYVPTPHDIVEAMLKMADVKKDDVVYDLGCGDGRIVVQAAKKCGCKGIGFEIVPKLAEQARENATKTKWLTL